MNTRRDFLAGLGAVCAALAGGCFLPRRAGARPHAAPALPAPAYHVGLPPAPGQAVDVLWSAAEKDVCYLFEGRIVRRISAPADRERAARALALRLLRLSPEEFGPWCERLRVCDLRMYQEIALQVRGVRLAVQ